MGSYPDTLYNSIQDLPYFNFIEILKTGDLGYLGKHKEPITVWNNIQDEYYREAKIDNTDIKQQGKVLALTKRYDFLLGCLEIIRHSHLLQEVEGFKETKKIALETMASFGYLFDHKKEFTKEYERVLRQVKGLKTKIEVESSKISKSNKKRGISLWKELVNLEQIVSNIKIDPYKDPVAKVIEVQKVAKEISNEQRNNRHNNRR